MHRRRFLATTALALSGSLVGCLDGTIPFDGSTPDRPWPPIDPVDEPEGPHHLYIENLTETTEAAWVRVTSETGAILVDGRYELPDGRGITYEAIAAWETTYAIDLAIDGEDPVSMAWYTAACGPDGEAPDGSRDAAVRVSEPSNVVDRVELRVDGCDEIHAPSVPAGSAESFRLDE